jgi:hypothetical protein
MKRLVYSLAFLVAALALAPPRVSAQCAFDRPTQGNVTNTGDLRTSLVQAYVGCGNPGGNPPNTINQGGVPACAPPETFNVQAGSPASGWRFSQVPGVSWGRLELNRQSGVFVNPPGIRDTRIRLNLRKIVLTNGTTPVAAGTPGTIALVLRATVNDPVNNDMTILDFPINIPFAFTTAGTVTNFTAILGTVMNSSVGFRFPDCASIEVVSVAVLDSNGNVFAVPGIRVIP